MTKRTTQTTRGMQGARPDDTFDDGAAEAIASLDTLVSDPLDIAASAQAQVEAEPATQYLPHRNAQGAVVPEEAPTTYVQRDGRQAVAAEEAPTTYVQRSGRQAVAAEEAPTTYVRRTREAADATVQAPPTVRRPSAQRGGAGNGAQRRGTAARSGVYAPGSTQAQMPPTAARPQVAHQQDRAPLYAVPSQPYDDPYVADYERARSGRRRSSGRPASGGRSTVLSVLLRFVALAPRLAAIALCALVVVGSVPFVANRGIIVDALNMADGLMPDRLVGLFVLQTPFGGAFRGDMALMALALFVVDWALVRISALAER